MDTVEVGRLRESAIHLHLFRQPLVMGGQAGKKSESLYLGTSLDFQ